MNAPHVTFTLSIDSGNDGVVDDPAQSVADILARVATWVADGYNSGYLRDYNGQRVGFWELDLTRETVNDDEEN